MADLYLIEGQVQGVGFRPFIYRLAMDLQLMGTVRNTSVGVEVHLEGEAEKKERFHSRLLAEKPLHARLEQVSRKEVDDRQLTSFSSVSSTSGQRRNISLPPDLATCSNCLADTNDPKNRRYLYPFTSCCDCGPRYSILEELPYDRSATTMRHFPLCSDCQAEYNDPNDRRFHAESLCCPVCGPQLQFLDNKKNILGNQHEALEQAVAMLKSGAIVAVKGLSGFHLMLDPRNSQAIQRLRNLKQRPEKPFALMAGLEDIHTHSELSEEEKTLLKSPSAPIVLVKKREDSDLSEEIAPGSNKLGFMLPCTSLHHRLSQMFSGPLIATSGNRHDERICYENQQAFDELSDFADYFLCHDREIIRPLDDSIARIIAGEPSWFRCGRGIAPIQMKFAALGKESLSTGALMKNSFALCDGENLIVSQHIGELSSPAVLLSHKRERESLLKLTGIEPREYIADLHPDCPVASSFEEEKKELHRVQHHFAHVLAVAGEHNLQPPYLGVAFDGVGYAGDGDVWGGEFIAVEPGRALRVARLRPFGLPGADAAARDGRRVALSLLWEIYGEEMKEPQGMFSGQEFRLLKQMIKQAINTPICSSVGRLFDAVSALLEIKLRSTYEGQAAVALEQAAESYEAPFESLPLEISEEAGFLEIDWRPAIASLWRDFQADPKSARRQAARFHHWLAEAIIEVGRRSDYNRIILSGGCFQNRILVESVIEKASERQSVIRSKKLPSGDGGLSAGQILARKYQFEES